MFEDKVLVVKLASIDGFAPCAIVVGEVSSLAHELRDDTVETAALEPKTLLMGAQAAEILCHGTPRHCGYGSRPARETITRVSH